MGVGAPEGKARGAGAAPRPSSPGAFAPRPSGRRAPARRPCCASPLPARPVWRVPTWRLGGRERRRDHFAGRGRRVSHVGRCAAVALRGRKAERGEAGGGPEQSAGGARHRVLSPGVQEKSCGKPGSVQPCVPAAPPPRSPPRGSARRSRERPGGGRGGRDHQEACRRGRGGRGGRRHVAPRRQQFFESQSGPSCPERATRDTMELSSHPDHGRPSPAPARMELPT